MENIKSGWLDVNGIGNGIENLQRYKYFCGIKSKKQSNGGKMSNKTGLEKQFMTAEEFADECNKCDDKCDSDNAEIKCDKEIPKTIKLNLEL